MKTAAVFRSTIEEIYNIASGANDILQLMLPDDKKSEIQDQITELKTRMEILKKTDERLEFIDDFNKRLNIFDQGVKDMENWLGEGRKRLDLIKNPPEEMSPEDRVTKSMEPSFQTQRLRALKKSTPLVNNGHKLSVNLTFFEPPTSARLL